MKSLFEKSYLTLVYSLLYFPILVLIVYSFNSARFSLQWHGFSNRWYLELFHDSDLWSAFLHSTLLGLTAALLSALMGLVVCLHLFLRNTQKTMLINILLQLIIIPDIVLGVALLIFFNLAWIPLGFFSLSIAHITFCLPFTILTINSRIHNVDVNVYYSALDLGASRMQALLRVLLPLLWPAILSAVLLAFTLSFDDVIISFFVAGPEFNILPLTIYSLVRSGVTPELNALCTITLIISMVLVIMSHLLSRKSTT